MAFWNKGDDPWNRKPDKPRTEPKAPQAIPLDSLKAWNEKRKAAAKEREEAKQAEEQTPAPIPCPWCGRPTETGYLMITQVAWWVPGYPNSFTKMFGTNAAGIEGAWTLRAWPTAWYCKGCRRLIVDCPAPPPEFEERLRKTMSTQDQKKAEERAAQAAQTQEQTEEETGD